MQSDAARSKNTITALGLVTLLVLTGLAGLTVAPGALAGHDNANSNACTPPGTDDPATSQGSVHFVQLDRKSVLERAFGPGDEALIRVCDNDQTEVSSVTVNVRTDLDSDGEEVRLERTPGTPLFFGTVGFERTIRDGNGHIGVEDGSIVTVTYQDQSHNAARVHSIIWKTAETGEPELDETLYQGTLSDVVVRVTDKDRNRDKDVRETIPSNPGLDPRDPTLDEPFLLVQSDTMRNLNLKDFVVLRETGENTGVFEATLNFEFGNTTAHHTSDTDNVLLIQHDDDFTVTYTDTHDESGKVAEATAKAHWRESHTATVHFQTTDLKHVVGEFDPTGADFQGLGQNLTAVRVYDLDRAGAGRVNVRVASTVDPIGLTLELRETGDPEGLLSGTGEFTGFFGYTTGNTDPNRNLLEVASAPARDTITGTYKDPLLETGNKGEVKTCKGTGNSPPSAPGDCGHPTADADWPQSGASVEWSKGDTGDIQLFSDWDLVTNAATARGSGDTVFIKVSDEDLNTDTTSRQDATVRVTSTRDPVGVDVTVYETAVNSGEFRGIFHFKTSKVHRTVQDPDSGSFDPSFEGQSLIEDWAGTNACDPLSPAETSWEECAHIWVEDGDVVTAEYIDEFTAGGTRNARVTDTLQWIRTYQGQIIFAGYLAEDQDGERQEQRVHYYGESDLSESTGATLGQVYVYDPDVNVKSTEEETVQIKVTSEHNGQPIGEITITLTEVGTNSGLFMSRFGFKCAPGSVTGSGISQLAVQCSSSDETVIGAEYSDAFGDTGGSATVTTVNNNEVFWKQVPSGTCTLSTPINMGTITYYGVEQRARAVTYRSDVSGSFNAEVETSTGRYDVEFEETSTGSSIFMANWTWNTSASPPAGHVGVDSSIPFENIEMSLEGCGAVPHEDVVEWRPMPSTGGVSLEVQGSESGDIAYGTQDRLLVRVDRAPANFWQFNVSTADVFLDGTGGASRPDNAETMTVTVVELDPDTGLLNLGSGAHTQYLEGHLDQLVDFESDAVEENAKLKVEDNGELIATYPAEGIAIGGPDSIVWNPMGTLKYYSGSDYEDEVDDYLGYDDAMVFVELVDPYFNSVEWSPDYTTVAQKVPVRFGSPDKIRTSGQEPDEVDWNADEGPDQHLRDGICVVLTETSANSGIFQGFFGLDPQTTSDVDDILRIVDDPLNPEIIMGAVPHYRSIGDPSDPCAGSQTSFDPSDAVIRSDVEFIPAFGEQNQDPPTHTDGILAMERARADPSAPNTPEGGIPGAFFGTKDVAHVRLVDRDDVVDRTINADKVNVTVRSDSDLTGFQLAARELYARHGEFRWDGREPGNPLGSLSVPIRFSLEGSDPAKGIIHVADDDVVQIRYIDERDQTGQSLVRSHSFRWFETTTGSLLIDKDQYAQEASTAELVVVDPDQNTRQAQVDTVTVRVYSDTQQTGDAGNPGHDEFVTLTETGQDTGIFSGTVEYYLDDDRDGLPDDANAPCDRTGTVSDPEAPMYSDGCLLVRDEDRLTYIYTDRFDIEGDSNEQRVQEAIWYETSVINLDKRFYATESAQAEVVLEDDTMDTTTGVDTVPVQVFSQSDARGFLLDLVETEGNSGIFEGTLRFSENATGSGRLRVSDGGEFTVYYFDEMAQQARTDRGIWDRIPNQDPIATITPDKNTFFEEDRESVTFRLDAEDPDPDGRIVSWTFDFGDDTPTISDDDVFDRIEDGIVLDPHPYHDPGTYRARLTVTDDKGATTTAEATIRVLTPDVTPPGRPQIRVVDERTEADKVTLRWTGVPDDVGDDDSGAVDSYLVKYVKDPTGTVAGSEQDWEDASTAEPAKLAFDPRTDELAAPGETQEVTVTGLDASSEYWFMVKALDEAGLNSSVSNIVAATTTEVDTSPPTGVLNLVSPTHPDEGGNYTQPEATFAWTALDDAQTTPLYHYRLTQQEGYNVTEDDEFTADTRVELTVPELGSWCFVVNGFAADLPADAEERHCFNLVEREVPNVTTSQIAAANEALQDSVEARIQGDGVLVTWDADTLPTWAAGVQIWRFDSPAILVQDVPSTDSAFGDGRYFDPDGSKSSRYIVTVYAFAESAGGHVTDVANAPGYNLLNEDDLAEQGASVGGEAGSAIPWFWILVLIAVAGLLIVGLLVALVVRSGGSQEGVYAEPEEEAWPAQEEEEWAEEDDEQDILEGEEEEDEIAFGEGEMAGETEEMEEGAEEEAAPPVHYLTCPSCEEEFSAEGEKPMVLECPECGAKGLFR